jgi:hypothetical protein
MRLIDFSICLLQKASASHDIRSLFVRSDNNSMIINCQYTFSCTFGMIFKFFFVQLYTTKVVVWIGCNCANFQAENMIITESKGF